MYDAFLRSAGICTDTRKLEPNTLFFALKGANFNGNKFASQALASGCTLAIIDEAEHAQPSGTLLVNDVLSCLQALAKHHRRQLTIPVIGITGSNGKTSTKELIHGVLSQRFNTFATHGNLNNHIGVPLSLLSIGPEVEMAVIEMGANHQGEIAELCAIAEPDHGMITNIGKAHLEGFGGPEGVKKGKNELYVHLRQAAGTAFVNANDSVLMELSEPLTRITYGTGASAHCQGELLDAGDFVALRWHNRDIYSQMVGGYNFNNMMAAICIGEHFGVPAEAIKTGIEAYVPENNRSQLLKTERNTLIMDAYNANPISMEVALRNFAKMASPATSLPIVGDMLELGEFTATEHQKVVNLMQELGFARALVVGAHFGESKLPEGYHAFPSNAEAGEWVKAANVSGSHVLIKGSRGIRLEVLAEFL